MRRLLFCLIAGLLLVAPAAAQPAKGTFLRVLNFWPLPVGISIDGQTALETLVADDGSAYLPLAAGTHTITLSDPADDTLLHAPLEISAADGHNYLLALGGTPENPAHAFVLDETSALRSANLQRGSVFLLLNVSDTPLTVFFGSLNITLAAAGYAAGDAPAGSSVLSVFAGDAALLQAAFTGVPNAYSLLALAADAENGYRLLTYHYSSLNAAEFLAGFGIGGAQGVDLALAAFENAGLLDELAGAEPLSVFVPVNAAVDAVPEETLDAWLETRIFLEAVMAYHIVPGDHSLLAVRQQLQRDAQPVAWATLQGAALAFGLLDDSLSVGSGTGVQARLLGVPYRVRNGMIYLIDRLLTPPALPQPTPTAVTTPLPAP